MALELGRKISLEKAAEEYLRTHPKTTMQVDTVVKLIRRRRSASRTNKTINRP